MALNSCREHIYGKCSRKQQKKKKKEGKEKNLQEKLNAMMACHKWHLKYKNQMKWQQQQQQSKASINFSLRKNKKKKMKKSWKQI